MLQSFHAGDRGSNPLGDANYIRQLVCLARLYVRIDTPADTPDPGNLTFRGPFIPR